MCYTICPITCTRLSDYSANCSNTFTHKHSHTHRCQLARLRTRFMLASLLMFTCTVEQNVSSQTVCKYCAWSHIRADVGPAIMLQGLSLQGQSSITGCCQQVSGVKGAPVSTWSQNQLEVLVLHRQKELKVDHCPAEVCVLIIEILFEQNSKHWSRALSTERGEGSHLLLFVLKFTSQL